MNNLALCSLVLELVEKSDYSARVDDLLEMLQRSFISVFKASELAQQQQQVLEGSSKPLSPSPFSTAASLESNEEARLAIVRAVRIFHERTPRAHPQFFHNSAYHPQAALFIHELLKSLAGNSQQWFRALQIDSLKACISILGAIGGANVRLCVPGVVSATVRYINRAHLGKDSAAVRLAAVEVLRTALTVALSSPMDENADPAGSAYTVWTQGAVPHLGSVLRAMLDPANLVKCGYDSTTVAGLMQMLVEVLSSPGMHGQMKSVFAHEACVAVAVLENLRHLNCLTSDVDDNSEDGGSQEAKGPSRLVLRKLFSIAEVQDALSGAVTQLRGVELLHVATTVLRFRTARNIIISHRDGVIDAGGSHSSELFRSLIRKCVRLVGTTMPNTDLYTSRTPRAFPAGAVDEFIECLAHALAELPADLSHEDQSAGEFLTNVLLEDCAAALEDWDLYMAHPSTIYVLSRAVLWQFKPIPPWLKRDFGPAQEDIPGCFPSPDDFVETGTFEQLWSIVAAPHLWNITEDEALCTFQQIHHRQVVAATVLRFLNVAATDVMRHQQKQQQLASSPLSLTEGEVARTLEEEERMVGDTAVASPSRRLLKFSHAFERFCTLTTYLVMEKAAASGAVRETAIACLDAFSSASGADEHIDFFLSVSPLIADEASRAVKERHLRAAAASVLRGAIAYINQSNASRGATKASTECGADGSSNSYPQSVAGGGGEAKSVTHDVSSSTASERLPSVLRSRLSVMQVQSLVRRQRVPSDRIAPVADFVSTAVHVATDSCRVAKMEDDMPGLRASLALLRDCADIAAMLNFSTPLEACDEDQERPTTSFHPRVKLLQVEMIASIYAVLALCSTSVDRCAPATVQVVVRGLTALLTSSEAVEWVGMQQAAKEAARAEQRKAKRNGDKIKKRRHDGAKSRLLSNDEQGESTLSSSASSEEDEGEDAVAALQLTSPPLDWHLDSQPPPTILLPRSHLKTVYRAYVSFVAMLREPISAVSTTKSRVGHRSGAEKRTMESIAVTPSLFAVLAGLESLYTVALDFLATRMVQEVLPLALVWYERGALPRIPTNTDERVMAECKHFAERLLQAVGRLEGGDRGLGDAIREGCGGFFSLPSQETEEEQTNPCFQQQEKVKVPFSASVADDSAADVWDGGVGS